MMLIRRWRSLRLVGLIGLVLVALLSAPTWSYAQASLSGAAETAVEEVPIDPAAVERLIRTLEDEQARTRLVEELRALHAAQEEAEEPAERLGLAGRALQSLSIQIGALGDTVDVLAQGFAGLPELGQWTVDQLGDPGQRRYLFMRLLTVVAALLAGAVAYAAVVTVLRRLRGSIEVRQPQPPLARFGLLTTRLVLDLVAAGAFLLAGMAVLSLVGPPYLTSVLALALINATALTLAIMAVVHFLFASTAPGLRLLRLNDETAHYLHLWMRRLTIVAVFGLQVADAVRLLGAPLAAHELMVRLVGLLLALMFTVLVLQNRREVSGWLVRMSGDRQRSVMGSVIYRAADIWYVLAIAAIIVVFAIWFMNPGDGGRSIAMAIALSVAIAVVARLAEHLVDQAVVRGFRVPRDLAARYAGLELRANRYVPIMRWTLSILVWTAAIVAVLTVWGLEVIGWLTAGDGRTILGSFVSIAIIIGLAAVVWEVVSSAIERYLGAQDGTGQAVARSARVRTLLPLLRNVFLVFLIAVVGLTVLSEVGLDITPLLAGAGIIGLAIGFGSQALVRDIITGLFILIEDTVSIGDVATFGTHTGVVEAMSMRTVRLRDLSGSVHTVPWGDVTSVVNLTKDFGYYLMDIGVAYREDVDAVIGALTDLGAEFEADPEFGIHLLGPIEILGLDQFGDNAVVIKARLKTVPLMKWMVGREFNRRMKRRFDELGIEIPFPHRTIYFGEDKKGSAPPARILVSGSSSDGTEARDGEQGAQAKRPRSRKKRQPAEAKPESSG